MTATDTAVRTLDEPTTPTGEVRVTSTTGGQKGSKPARFDLIPSGPLTDLAIHFGIGAAKYSDNNWRLGTDWSLNFAALCRHLFAFWGGEDVDPETGSPHLSAVAWHAMVLREFQTTSPQLDNRPSTLRREGRDVWDVQPPAAPQEVIDHAARWAGYQQWMPGDTAAELAAAQAELSRLDEIAKVSIPARAYAEAIEALTSGDHPGFRFDRAGALCLACDVQVLAANVADLITHRLVCPGPPSTSRAA